MSGVIILTRRTPASYYLINKVLASKEVTGVVFQKMRLKTQLAILSRRAKRLGLKTVANQVLLLLFVQIFERRTDKRSLGKIFFDQPFDRLTKDIDILEVEDINSSEVTDFILARSPSLVVVSGTSLLKDHIMRLLTGRIVNMHVGITPEYRGAYGGFWALYNGEPEMVGVTVHLINPGIDTGAILFQEKVAINNSDTLMSIVYKQQKEGVELILKCINEFEGKPLRGYQKMNSISRLYYSPGLTHYLQVKKLRLKMRNKQ